MLKASLCFWLIVLLTLPVISAAQPNDFSLNFFNSLKLRRFEQSTNFNLTPFQTWQMQVIGKNAEDKRIDFAQTSRNSTLYLTMTKNHKLLSQSIQTGYEYLYDYSNLESELYPYFNKTGFIGLGVTLLPLDSLRLETLVKAYYRQEQDRYVEKRN